MDRSLAVPDGPVHGDVTLRWDSTHRIRYELRYRLTEVSVVSAAGLDLAERAAVAWPSVAAFGSWSARCRPICRSRWW